MRLLIENNNLFGIIIIYLKCVLLVSPILAAPLSALVSMYFFLSPCSIFTSLFFIL